MQEMFKNISCMAENKQGWPPVTALMEISSSCTFYVVFGKEWREEIWIRHLNKHRPEFQFTTLNTTCAQLLSSLSSPIRGRNQRFLHLTVFSAHRKMFSTFFTSDHRKYRQETSSVDKEIAVWESFPHSCPSEELSRWFCATLQTPNICSTT